MIHIFAEVWAACDGWGGGRGAGIRRTGGGEGEGRGGDQREAIRRSCRRIAAGISHLGSPARLTGHSGDGGGAAAEGYGAAETAPQRADPRGPGSATRYRAPFIYHTGVREVVWPRERGRGAGEGERATTRWRGVHHRTWRHFSPSAPLQPGKWFAPLWNSLRKETL